VYLGLTFMAPKSVNPNPYHLSVAVTLLLVVTIIGLWMMTCFSGLLAWLRLDTYAHVLPQGSNRRAYEQFAQGVRILAYGLLLSSVLGVVKRHFPHDIGTSVLLDQINYYVVLIAPFLGFLFLRLGTKRLAVSAHAAMTLRAKIVTVGPPVLLLASFYVYLAATNTAAGPLLGPGPIGFLMLPLNITLVVGSWVLGLLAALNIERATHRRVDTNHTQPMVKLYNGTLTMTGGFIILDALLSLGSDRLASLPLSVTVTLVYAFIAVVALGFMLVSTGARALLAAEVEARK
jgi:hypothetical protein